MCYSIVQIRITVTNVGALLPDIPLLITLIINKKIKEALESSNTINKTIKANINHDTIVQRLIFAEY